MAINGVKAEVSSGLKRFMEDVYCGRITRKSAIVERLDRLIALLGDIPKIKKPLEDILDEIYASCSKNENATALLEECLCNGDKGLQPLYAWFLGERDTIEAAIKDFKEERQS